MNFSAKRDRSNRLTSSGVCRDSPASLIKLATSPKKASGDAIELANVMLVCVCVKLIRHECLCFQAWLAWDLLLGLHLGLNLLGLLYWYWLCLNSTHVFVAVPDPQVLMSATSVQT